MNNKLDKFFRQMVGGYNLPNDGPQWADLEKRMKGKKPSYLLFFTLGLLLFILGFYASKLNNKTSLAQSANKSNLEQRYVDTNLVTESSKLLNPSVVTKPERIGSKEANSENALKEEKHLNEKINPIPHTQRRLTKPTEMMTMGDNKDTSGNNERKVETNGNPTPTTSQILATVISTRLVLLQSKMEVQIDKSRTENSSLRTIKFKPSIFGVYVSISPSTINSISTFNVDSKTHKDYEKYRSKGEQLKSGLGLEFGLLYNPIKKLTISTGFIFEKRYEQVNYKFSRTEVPVLDSATREIFGYVTLSDSAAEKIDYSNHNSYTYSGILLNMKYQIYSIARFRFGILINGNYLRNTLVKGKTINQGTLQLEDLTMNNSNQMRQFFNVGLGANIGYRISNRFELILEPRFATQLSNNKTTNKAKQGGLNLGIRIHL